MPPRLYTFMLRAAILVAKIIEHIDPECTRAACTYFYVLCSSARTLGACCRSPTPPAVDRDGRGRSACWRWYWLMRARCWWRRQCDQACGQAPGAAWFDDEGG